MRLCGANIHSSVKVYGSFFWIGDPQKLKIGAGTTINQGVVLELRESINIGKNVRISSLARLHTSRLELTPTDGRREHTASSISIEDNVWIASGAIVLSGVTVGENSVLSANSVAAKDIPKNTLYSGIPSIEVRKINSML